MNWLCLLTFILLALSVFIWWNTVNVYFLVSQGIWALYLWSNSTISCDFCVLELVWCTCSTNCYPIWRSSFTGSTTVLQCSGTVLGSLTLTKFLDYPDIMIELLIHLKKDLLGFCLRFCFQVYGSCSIFLNYYARKTKLLYLS